jgi:hypothetical protein
MLYGLCLACIVERAQITHARTEAPRYMEGRDRTFPKLGNLAPRGMQHAKCSIGIRRERKSSMRACVERAGFPQGSDAYCAACGRTAHAARALLHTPRIPTLHAVRSLVLSQDAASKSTAPGCPLGVLVRRPPHHCAPLCTAPSPPRQTNAPRAHANGIIAARRTATACCSPRRPHAPCGGRRASRIPPASPVPDSPRPGRSRHPLCRW